MGKFIDKIKSFFSKVKNVFSKQNKKTRYGNRTYFAGSSGNFIPQSLTEQELLVLSYFTKSVQMIANDIGKIDWKIFDPNGSEAKHQRLSFLLNSNPNDRMSGYHFKKLLIWNLFLFGSAPILVVRDDNNKVIELVPIFPDVVMTQYDDDGNLYYELLAPEYENIKLDKSEIIMLFYESIISVENVSFRNLFKSTLAKLKQNEMSIYNAIKNDTGMALIVNVPDYTDSNAIDQVQQSISEMITNQKEYGYMAFVKDKRWEMESSSPTVLSSPVDYQQRNAIAREVAAIFGIPPSKLGIEDTNKYNTMVERNRQYADDALKPLLNNICATLTHYFYPTASKYIGYSNYQLLSIDPGALKDFAASAINNAFCTPNEIRKMLGLDPIEGGDVLMANSAIQPIELIRKNLEKLIESDSNESFVPTNTNNPNNQ